jgi:hypothetical protein
MGNSESNNENYSNSSSPRSYTSKSSKSLSVGRGSCGNLRETFASYVNLSKKIDEVILLKRQIENHPVFHWGFFFIVNNVIICIEYTDRGVLINLFNNLSEGFKKFAAKANIVYYKNMKDFQSSGCNLGQILDRVSTLVVSNGFIDEGYNVIGRNCQHFVVRLAEPFDYNVKNANKPNFNLPMLGGIGGNPYSIIGELVLNRDDDSIFYELESNIDPKSLAKRGFSLAKMKTYNV